MLGKQDIHVSTFGSKNIQKISTKYTKVSVKLKNGNKKEITVNIVPFISGELQRRPVKDLLESERVHDIIDSVQLADSLPTEDEMSPIEFLIGNDYYLDFVLSERIEIKPGLYLLASNLGWILSGRTCNTEVRREDDMSMLILTHASNTINECTFASMDKNLQTTKIAMDDLWNIEAIGMTDKQVDTDDEIAMKKFRETIQYKDKRYFVTWPWKNEETDISLNRELAVGRLRSTVNRMKNKPELMQKYDNVIQEQFTKGIIERVETKRVGIVHYLTHHAVITPQKTTTKLRVVYDASSKSKQSNKSLNECLYRGPVMLHDLCGMLMRFRLHKIALVSDIEKAFLQIGLQESQRDVTRFVWLKDINNPRLDNRNIDFAACLSV